MPNRNLLMVEYEIVLLSFHDNSASYFSLADDYQSFPFFLCGWHLITIVTERVSTLF